jgi:histone H2A
VASVLEYLTAELLESAGDCAKAAGYKRIKPRHLTLAIKSDEMMNLVVGDATLHTGGIIPHIEAAIETKVTTTKRRRQRKSQAKN